jgi:hypothetical protein
MMFKWRFRPFLAFVDGAAKGGVKKGTFLFLEVIRETRPD